MAENRELYARYEEALLRRDNLKREAEHYRWDYVSTFGGLITEAFELKVECIRLKKMIAFCQRQVNLGRKVEWATMTAAVEEEMTEYVTRLEAMQQEYAAALDAKPVSAADLAKIKKAYYRLVKKLHPDLHPDLAEDETVKAYWAQISLAYQGNNLARLEELELLVAAYLESIGYEDALPEIDDLEAKIVAVEQEIQTILATVPYTYKFLLDDPVSVRDKKQELKDEIASYRKYLKELEEVLAGFQVERTLS